MALGIWIERGHSWDSGEVAATGVGTAGDRVWLLDFYDETTALARSVWWTGPPNDARQHISGSPGGFSADEWRSAFSEVEAVQSGSFGNSTPGSFGQALYKFGPSEASTFGIEGSAYSVVALGGAAAPIIHLPPVGGGPGGGGGGGGGPWGPGGGPSDPNNPNNPGGGGGGGGGGGHDRPGHPDPGVPPGPGPAPVVPGPVVPGNPGDFPPPPDLPPPEIDLPPGTTPPDGEPPIGDWNDAPQDTTTGEMTQLTYVGRVGIDRPNCIFAWDTPPYNVSQMQNLDDGQETINVLKAFGATAEGGDAITTLYTDAASKALIGQYFGTQTWSFVKDLTTLQAYAAAYVKKRRLGLRTVSFTPIAGKAPIPFEDFDKGDTVRVAASWRMRGGFFEAHRVNGWDVSLTNENVEVLEKLYTDEDEG